ncbi:MAG: DMT family transporter [Pseudomonadota bacterium]
MDSGVRAGFAFGVLSAVMWALYFVYARKAATFGLSASDVVLLRYGVAALVMLPWVLRAGLRDLAGVGWSRGAVLALCVGPVFLWLAARGFHHAPLSHGAVIQPSTAVVVATLIAVAALGERPSRGQAVGLALVLAGIGLIGAAGGTMPGAWRGQILFVAAGAMWAMFTILLRVWGVPGLAATAAVNVISAAVVVPVYLVTSDGSALLGLPATDLLMMALVHGVLAGVLAISAYGRAVALLGISRAALFPAIVPATALVLGIPLAGEWPNRWEWTGAALATLGLMQAMGAVPGLRRFGL